MVEHINGADYLLAALVKLAVDDLSQGKAKHHHSAAVFLDEAGLLPLVCRARGVDYGSAVDVLLDGPPKQGGRR
ncbi:MAG: hypothetical protein CYG59_00665 [Chloroflexi bacterium]|nr:MAG: hypothetical protein CYG59_00665 [Chloroflexota bacterium]